MGAHRDSQEQLAQAQRLIAAALQERVVRPELVPWAYLNLARVDSELKDHSGAHTALQRAFETARRGNDDAAAERVRRLLANSP